MPKVIFKFHIYLDLLVGILLQGRAFHLTHLFIYLYQYVLMHFNLFNEFNLLLILMFNISLIWLVELPWLAPVCF